MKNPTNIYLKPENRMAPGETARFLIGGTIQLAEVRLVRSVFATHQVF